MGARCRLLVRFGKRSLNHGSGRLLISPHGLLCRRKANIITLRGPSKTNKAELWAVQRKQGGDCWGVGVSSLDLGHLRYCPSVMPLV